MMDRGSRRANGGTETDSKWPSKPLVAPLGANYRANGANARDEMSLEDERGGRPTGKP